MRFINILCILFIFTSISYSQTDIKGDATQKKISKNQKLQITNFPKILPMAEPILGGLSYSSEDKSKSGGGSVDPIKSGAEFVSYSSEDLEVINERLKFILIKMVKKKGFDKYVQKREKGDLSILEQINSRTEYVKALIALNF